MNPAIAMLRRNLVVSRRLMLGSVRDLSAAELSDRPYPVDRSCARLLGMAAVADREVLRLLNVDGLPDVPAGFEARFAPWGTGEDSETAGYDASLPAIFAAHREGLIDATGSLGSDALDEPVDPPDYLGEGAIFRFGTIGEMILAAWAYTTFLVGEASIVRQALGKDPVDDPIDGMLAVIDRPVGPSEGADDRDAGVGR